MRMFIGVYFQVTSWLFEVISFLNVLLFLFMVVGINFQAPQRNCVEAESRGCTFVFHGWEQAGPASFYPFTASFLEGCCLSQ